MAGDWIKFEISTPDKPEVWAIADDLDIDPDAVVGKLLRVWTWFDQQTEKGNAPSVTKKLLDRSVGVPGFCDSLVKVGWLGDDGKTITATNFDRHNGKTAKERALTAKRVAKFKKNDNAKGNAEVTVGALPREDKREDNIKNTKKDLALPEWIPADAWRAWKEQRRKQKKPVTDYAEKRAISKLEQLRTDGHDTSAIINQTIDNGWAGFFPVKTDAPGRRSESNLHKMQEFR